MRDSQGNKQQTGFTAPVRRYLAALFLLAGAALALAPLGYAAYASHYGGHTSSGALWQDGDLQTPPPMQISTAEKAVRGDRYKNAPELVLSSLVPKRFPSRTTSGSSGTLGSTLNLLEDRGYAFPSNRNQGGCGDCWVWAGTGVLEQALYSLWGINDILSVQYFSSTYYNGSGNLACCGGNVWNFTDYYSNALNKAIPWSNTNADFVDGGKSTCGPTLRSPGIISTTPNYPIRSISYARIPNSTSSDQATAIASIKSVLDSGKAIFFDFYLTNDVPANNDWGLFSSFWVNQPENAIYTGGFSCNKSATYWAGHAVVCVGYSDGNADPSNDCWIMMNSWGTRPLRPNGLFRIPMHYNYACSSGGYYNTEWYSIPVTIMPPVPAMPTLSSPTNGSNQAGASVTFSWNASPTATGYYLYVWDAAQNYIFAGQTGNVTSKTVTGFPNNGTLYYWVIYPFNVSGVGPHSPVWYIINGGSVPPMPTLVSPPIATNQPGTSVTFTWNASPTATGYYLYVWDAAQNYIFAGQTGNVTSKTVTGFPNNGTAYYWVIYPFNLLGVGPHSQVWYFVNNGTVPPAPVLVSPATGSQQPGTSVTFTWNASPTATGYYLYVWDAAQNYIFAGQTVNVTSKTVTGFPNNGTLYYWVIYPFNLLGVGPRSSVWNIINGP